MLQGDGPGLAIGKRVVGDEVLFAAGCVDAPTHLADGIAIEHAVPVPGRDALSPHGPRQPADHVVRDVAEIRAGKDAAAVVGHVDGVAGDVVASCMVAAGSVDLDRVVQGIAQGVAGDSAVAGVGLDRVFKPGDHAILHHHVVRRAVVVPDAHAFGAAGAGPGNRVAVAIQGDVSRVDCDTARVVGHIEIRVQLIDPRLSQGRAVEDQSFLDAIVVEIRIAHVTDAVAVIVGLVSVGLGRAVVHPAAHAVSVLVVGRVGWAGVADITHAVSVRIGLVRVGSHRAIVHIAARTVVVRIVGSIQGACVADIAGLVFVTVRLVSVDVVGTVVPHIGHAVTVVIGQLRGGAGNRGVVAIGIHHVVPVGIPGLVRTAVNEETGLGRIGVSPEIADPSGREFHGTVHVCLVVAGAEIEVVVGYPQRERIRGDVYTVLGSTGHRVVVQRVVRCPLLERKRPINAVRQLVVCVHVVLPKGRVETPPAARQLVAVQDVEFPGHLNAETPCSGAANGVALNRVVIPSHVDALSMVGA